MSGTGKSLSIICSALQWLIDRKEKANNSDKVDDGGEEDESEPDWIRNFTVTDDNKTIKSNTKSPLFRFRKRVPQAFSGGHSVARNEKEVSVKKQEAGDEVNEQEFLLEEYESQEDSSSSSKRKPSFVSSSEDEEDNKECSDEEADGLKVFYCSRTHSQLSQFVKELKKTVFAQKLKVVCLGSRKNMCINEGLPPLSFFSPLYLCVCLILTELTDVLKLGNVGRINERCLDLQTKKPSQVSKKKVTTHNPSLIFVASKVLMEALNIFRI